MLLRFSALMALALTLAVDGAAGGPPAQPPIAKAADENTDHDTITLSPDRIAAARIETAPVGPGELAHRLTVPGTVTPDSNRIARIAARVMGTVAELRKQLGDPVRQGEVVAVLDSREVAEAKSELISAHVNVELQKTLFEREQRLARASIIAEIQFLKTNNTFKEAQLRFSLARQKLAALGVADKEIAGLSANAVALQRYELRSPIAGRITERFVDLGAPVGREGQASEIYVVVDLSTVWIDLALPLSELSAVKQGQSVTIATDAARKPSSGKIIFISPILNQETRSARVIASVANDDMGWRPGSSITARILVGKQVVPLSVPRAALQTIEGRPVAFVRVADGFQKRNVTVGMSDDRSVEVLSGLVAGEHVAVGNSFLLKAELGKAEAGHDD